MAKEAKRAATKSSADYIESCGGEKPYRPIKAPKGESSKKSKSAKKK